MRTLLASLALTYPLLIGAGLVLVGPRILVAAAVVVLLLHVGAGWRRWRRDDVTRAAVPAVLVAAVLGAVAILDDGRLLLFVPALVNTAMLVSFARTLRGHGPSMIETFARLRHPELPASRGPYLRAVTWLWCAFFVVNIAVSVALAGWGTLAAWTVYNGVVAYILVGLLLAGERVYRYWRFRGYHGGPLDPIFRRVFPPPAAGGPR